MKRLEEPRMRNRKRKQESDHFIDRGTHFIFDFRSLLLILFLRRANLRGAKPAATPELS
jgi:hypothetical protein